MDITFGFGRRCLVYSSHLSWPSSCIVYTLLVRICPGRHIAHSILTLAAASVLSNFDLVKKVDGNGREIEPKREYTGYAILLVTFSILAFLHSSAFFAVNQWTFLAWSSRGLVIPQSWSALLLG
jgi:hypothetical protein